MTCKIIIKLFYKQRLRRDIWDKFINNLIKYPNICNYLENYYKYFFSYKETLFRLKHNLINENHCDFCNKVIPYKTHGVANFCNKICRYNYMHKKSKETFLEKYGVDNCNKIDSVKEKTKQTCLKKYGSKSYLSSKECRNKIKEKYGVNNVFKLDYIKDKIKQTNLEKFGYEYPIQSKEILKKSEETCLRKYGVTNWAKTKESRTYYKNHPEKLLKSKYKEHLTKIKNGSYQKSKLEDQSYELIKEKYSDVIRQFRNDLYPFNCDFYIPSLDLYIECHYSHFHCKHPFNSNNENDLKMLQELKEKAQKSERHKIGKKSQYDEMIYTWTDLDVRKRNIAKNNKLNYLEFYSILDLNNWLINNK